ncbi:MAG: nucleoside triphosphate pyrophosphohydrolase [Chloroflexota bacterium]|nr:nucleoside triphosphate pyrophosphohydrolase [Chloroflexota bacterium]
MTLTILGLGPGSVDDITRRAWRALETASVVIVRTGDHPCVPHLPRGADYRTCDDLYESIPDFAGVYDAIAARVLAAAESGDVVYAVPGDPANAEATVTRVRAGAGERGIFVEMISGISFIEPALALLGVDALDGVQLFDAITIADFHHPPLDPDYPALLGQVYSRDLASALKLTLMNQYPDEFEVALVHAAGTPDARVERVPLYAIDRSAHIRHLTALYIPALGGMRGFARFQEVIAHLRAPEGCPWDRKQTHLTLRPYLIEEAYEVLEAIESGDSDALCDELGDLLLQVVLHAQIATDDGAFRMGDVIRAVNSKMIRRHPHVWGDPTALGLPAVNGDSGQVVQNWEAIKSHERAAKGDSAPTSILGRTPEGLPALMQAVKYQKKAAKVGFDWTTIDGVIAKVREELDEVLRAESDAHRLEEIGDLLFVVANWARWYDIDSEEALRGTNAKFARRFGHIETHAAAHGRDLESLTPAEMDVLWNDAKALGL